jgi:hypothetical protein
MRIWKANHRDGGEIGWSPIMRRLSYIISGAALAVSLIAVPAMATPGGDQWVPAQQSEQTAIIDALNADLTSHDGQLHSANCYSIFQLRGHQALATVTIRQKTKPAACGTAKDFGIYVLRHMNDHWTILATSPGTPKAPCTYVAKAPAKVTSLLAKVGPCYAGQG